MKPKVGIFKGHCVLLWSHREPEVLTRVEALRLATDLLIATQRVDYQQSSEAQLLKLLKPVGEA